MPNKISPFYFICIFWGPKYREAFSDWCLAALLADRNIPAMSSEHRAESRAVIVTTPSDWADLQNDANFIRMSELIDPVYIEFTPPTPDEPKMLAMSRGHKLASEFAYRNKAAGIFLTPDLILSNGSVEAIVRLAQNGKKVVLCSAVRFTEEGCVKELRDMGALRPGAALSISARDLVGVAVRNLHSETLRYEWGVPYFAESPISPFWHVPGETGLVLYSFSWAPLLVDYAAIPDHDTSTFDKWTLDGDYVYRNFGGGHEDEIHVVTDSDEIMLVSFTSEKELHFDLVPQWPFNSRIFGELARMSALSYLYHSEVMDPLKRRIFGMAVRLHSAPLNKRWKKVERRAAFTIGQSVGIHPRSQQKLGGLSRFARSPLRTAGVSMFRRLGMGGPANHWGNLVPRLRNYRSMAIHGRNLLWQEIYVARKNQVKWIVVNRRFVARRIGQKFGLPGRPQ